MQKNIIIKVLNWNKYNPRKDFKNPVWFAFNNRMIEDSDLFDLSHGEFKAWVYILSKASQKASEEVLIKSDHADKVCNISKKDLFSSIEKLQQLGILECKSTDQVRGEYVASTDEVLYNTIQYTTEQNNTQQNSTQHFDFEILYKKYPLKKGKSDGISRLTKTVKSADEFELVSKAIDKYTHHIKKNGTEPKYIKQFSTFVSTWRDWLDDDAGTAIETKNKTNAQKMSDQNMEMMERVRRGEL